jgi:AcrR family transcriptional regulator
MSDGWDRRQLRTRAHVLDAAGEIIAAAGVEGLTMRKLAERAQVSVGTLYNQFGDRNGVLVAFVSAGLDRLEFELDERPALGPIDSTRALFDGLDRTLAAGEAVWRPLLATLESTPGVDGLGAVGSRITRHIEHDFAKAAANDMFAVDGDTERLAQHVFVTRMDRLQKWAEGAIDWERYRASSALGLELTLAAVLAEPFRSDAFRRSGIVS